MTKLPAGVIVEGHLFLEVDQLVKKLRKTKKVAIKSYKDFYEHRIKEWVAEGDDFDIRAERDNIKQTARNIEHAIDAIIDSIETTKEQA